MLRGTSSVSFVALATLPVYDLIDLCITHTDLYCSCRVLVPALGMGRILTARQLTRAVHAYAGVKWNGELMGVEQMAHLVSTRWGALELQGCVPVLTNCNSQKNMAIVAAEDSKLVSVTDRLSKAFDYLVGESITVAQFNMVLDVLLSVHYRHPHAAIDMAVKALLDVCYVSATAETRTQMLQFTLRVVIDELGVSRGTLFRALDKRYGVKLSSAIWSARSSLQDVLFGLEGSAGKAELGGTIPVYIDFAPNAPLRPMRCIRKKSGKLGGHVMTKKQYQFLASKVRYSPAYNDIPEFIRQKDAKVSVSASGVCVEEKLDGERSNVHFFRDEPGCMCMVCAEARSTLGMDPENGVLRCSFFSRARTSQVFYGKYVGDPAGIITRSLNYRDFAHVDAAILDGEMVALDATGAILGFAQVKEAASAECKLISEGLLDAEAIVPPTNVYCSFYAYDCLLFNNIKLQYLPLVYRKRVLNQAFSASLNARFKINRAVSASDREALDKQYGLVRKRHGEGIVVKAWDSMYTPGTDDKCWVKIKPEHLGDDRVVCDALILGKKGNHTVRGGGYLLGLRHNNTYVCIGKLNYTNGVGDMDGKGRENTTAQWKTMQRIINQRLEYSWTTGDTPPEYKFGTTKPDHFVSPTHSIVVEVTAQRVVDPRDRRVKYGDTHRLKDVRMRAIRHDKVAEDTDHFDDIMAIKLVDFIDYSAEDEEEESTDDDVVITKRRKLPTKHEQMLNRGPRREVRKISNLFQGMTFCVFNDGKVDGELVRKPDLCHDIKENGGEIVHAPTRDAVLIGDIQSMLPKAVLEESCNVINYQWVADCIISNYVLEPDSTHVTAGSELFLRKADTMRDYFGLSEHKLVTKWGLTRMYDYWKENGAGGPQNISVRGDWDINKLFKLVGRKFYLVHKSGHELERKMAEVDITQQGGELVMAWAHAHYVVTFGASVCETNEMKEHHANSEEIPKLIKPVELYQLIKPWKEPDTSGKWYIIAPKALTEAKNELAAALVEKGAQVVPNWEYADYVLPFRVRNAFGAIKARLTRQQLVDPDFGEKLLMSKKSNL